jgi:Tol biopolymer transport system component
MSRAGHLRATGVLVAAVMLAMILLFVVAGARPADAAFPGKNGKIAFSKDNFRQGSSGIFTINPDGSEPDRLGPGYSPSWSADGGKVVFENFSGDGEEEFNQDIYVMNADGSGVEQVTSGRAYDFSPSFFPSGDKIAFVRESPRNGTDVFTKDLTTNELTKLTDDPGFYEESLAVSPDGTKIAYSRYNRSSEIFVMDSDGSDPQNITTTGRVDEFGPDWSPDGTKIAFTSYRFNFVEMGDAEEGKAFEPATIESEAAASDHAVEEEKVEVSVMNADGTQRKDLTSSPAYDTYPAFSPNGTRIAFTRMTFSRRSEESDIFVMRADGTGVRQLTDTRAFEWGPDWQPLP